MRYTIANYFFKITPKLYQVWRTFHDGLRKLRSQKKKHVCTIERCLSNSAVVSDMTSVTFKRHTDTNAMHRLPVPLSFFLTGSPSNIFVSQVLLNYVLKILGSRRILTRNPNHLFVPCEILTSLGVYHRSFFFKNLLI